MKKKKTVVGKVKHLMDVWSLFSHQSQGMSPALGRYESQPDNFEVIQHMEHTNIDFDYNVEGIPFLKCIPVAVFYCVLKRFLLTCQFGQTAVPFIW